MFKAGSEFGHVAVGLFACTLWIVSVAVFVPE
jgi:hypothetical protein